MMLHHGNFPARVFFIGTLALIVFLYAFLRFGFSWKEVDVPSLVGNEQKVHPVEKSIPKIPEIMNSTLGFQKLFVINMPSRTDRRDAVSLAAAISNFKIDFIDGVGGESIPEKALPPGGSGESVKLAKGIRGSWRSHMNALQEVVNQNLSTAMIFEDDVDWDIRVRSQLQNFAFASQVLTLRKLDFAIYHVDATENPEDKESIFADVSANNISSSLYSLPLSQITSHPPSKFPYGDPNSWDVLWLGHCGAGFPRPENPLYVDENNLLLTKPNDETVPMPKYLRAHPFGPLDALASAYPAHTHVYHRASGGALCTVAYAVSQRGARRLLQQYGLTKWSKIWDAELGEWCAGQDEDSLGGERRCFTSQPPIFAHHHPEGGESSIGGLGGGYAKGVETKYLRKSVRMNLGMLVRGGGIDEMEDQWPD